MLINQDMPKFVVLVSTDNMPLVRSVAVVDEHEIIGMAKFAFAACGAKMFSWSYKRDSQTVFTIFENDVD